MTNLFKPGGPPRYDHQKRGLNHLVRNGGIGALLFDPGLGKTAVVIDYASVLALKLPHPEVKVLVICPLVAVDTWVDQMGKWVSPDVNYWAEALGGTMLQRAEALASRGGNFYAKQLSKGPYTFSGDERTAHTQRAIAQASKPEVDRSYGPNAVEGPKIILEVVNIDTFSNRTRVGSRTMADVMLDAVKRYGPDVIVIDESHKIKSASSNVSRLMARLSPVTKRRILLTGTVMPSGPLDVFGQWRFLDPFAFGYKQAGGTWKQATFGGFKNRFAELGGWMGKEVVGYRNLDEMQKIMAKSSVVARKEEALDLPKTTDATLRVDLSPREQKAYADMKKQLATDIARNVQASTTSMLTQMMRLRQITSGHLPSDDGQMHVIGESKVRTIKSLIQDTLVGEKRIVIFALFTQEIEMLSKALREKGTEVMTISGKTPKDERIAMRKRFGSDDPKRMIMIAQIKTMSLAVNELVTASHAIFASMSQQRDEYIQARDRLNRIGQTRPVTFWHCIAPGTVDEVVMKAHSDRTDLETAMLRHIQGE